MTYRWIACPALIVVAGLAALVAPARANRFEGCQNTCRDLSGNITSDECVDTCNRAYCGQQRLTTSYGAIAFGAYSGATGWTYGKPDPETAEQVALSNWAHHGNDCEIVTSFSNSCAAVAGGDGGHFAAEQADSREKAEANALSSRAG
ncbi:MAG: DUF4189 domain-containing protein [Alphaproteobacteria bacterium]